MSRLRARDARAADEWYEQLGRLQSDLEADMDYWRAEDAKLSPTTGTGGYSSERNTVRGNMNSIGRCLGVVRDERIRSERSVQGTVRPATAGQRRMGHGQDAPAV
jgi:hypothetical protein